MVARVKAPKLDEAAIQEALGRLSGWALEDGMLTKTYPHPTFPEAIVFVNVVAHLAELADHHPDIDIRYSKITLRLVTHDSGGITAKDVDLAARIEDARKRAPAAS